MPPRKKKTDDVKSSVTSTVVNKPQPIVEPKRIVPEIPNTVHFYSHLQNLVRMESLDPTIRINADLIKQILNEIKVRKLLGTNLFTVVFKNDKFVVDKVTNILENDCDKELLEIINKIYTISEEKTEVVEV